MAVAYARVQAPCERKPSQITAYMAMAGGF
jgi:hypothetical protein